MAFPLNPTNGQSTTINGVVYVYNSTKGTWTRSTSGNGVVPSVVNGNLTVPEILTVTGNIIGSNINTSGTVTASSLISNVSTGTAPLTVTSTTQVANLNSATAGTVTTAAQPNITSVGTLSSLAVTGNANANIMNDSKGDVRAVPQVTKTTAFVLTAVEAGKHVSTNANVTVPNGVFSIGDSVTILNNSAASITIIQGASVTMYQVGTSNTGNRTLAQKGLATVFCYAANTFVITGGGMT